MRSVAAVLATTLSCAAAGSIIGDVRGAIARDDFAGGERLIAEYRQRSGVTPEMLEALSWLGRGSLAARRLDQADRYAAETRKLALEILKTRKLDDERRLPIALGASIEVQAQALAARGQRSEAVEFLTAELKQWGSTSMHERIRKNLNLLTLEGKPAPAIAGVQLKGRPTLLFLWAHWCGDCKAMAPALAALQKKYAGKGLRIVAPTKLYGYVARGEEAPAAQEKQYIEQVRQKFYGSIADMAAPVDASIFQTYGVSTTPTVVLVDRQGMVRLYHPGAMKGPDMDAKISSLLQ